MKSQSETHPAAAREPWELIYLLLLVIQSQSKRIRYYQAEDIRKAHEIDRSWAEIAQLQRERGEVRRAA